MSYKKWIHHCREHGNSEVVKSEKVCPECGEQGTFNGWGQSVIEMMSSYQRRYNLRALGPHRRMTDELFHGRMKKCDVCNGYGLLDSPDDDRGELCPKCDYGQLVFDGTPEEFESIRQKIIAAYPGADPDVDPTPPPTGSPEAAPAGSGNQGGGFFRPAGEGWQAYKDFVMGLYKVINPNAKLDSSYYSDEEWQEHYQKAMSGKKPKQES